MFRLSWNLGALVSWNPQGRSRPVIFFFFFLTFADEQMHIILEFGEFSTFGFFVFFTEVIYFLLDAVFFCVLCTNCVPSVLTACSQAVSRPVWNIPLLCVQWKTPDCGQRNCPKHVEFYSKNKFEKLVHVVDFIIRIIFLHVTCKIYVDFNSLCIPLKIVAQPKHFGQQLIYNLL